MDDEVRKWLDSGDVDFRIYCQRRARLTAARIRVGAALQDPPATSS